MDTHTQQRSKKHTVLVVEDEESIRLGLLDVLAFHGHAPEGRDHGEEGLQQALDGNYDLVILDVMLPGLDGFEICRRLRAEKPRQAILMLTAKGSEDDIVHGLSCGADDYVSKPFSIRELMARVHALLRRQEAAQERASVFAFGPWQVDREGLRAQSTDQTLALTQREVELMDLFARQAGRVVSRRTLLVDIWDLSNVDEISTRTVDVHIAKLRKKIDQGRRNLIETVRGVGYRAVL